MTYSLFDRVVTGVGVAPSLWLWEVATMLLTAEQRKRITATMRIKAGDLLAALPVRLEAPSTPRIWTAVVGLAAERRLTIYDASYLELALRLARPLASLDQALIRAARDCSVAVMAV